MRLVCSGTFFSSPFTLITDRIVFHMQLCMVLTPLFASFSAVVNYDRKAPCQFYDLGDLGWGFAQTPETLSITDTDFLSTGMMLSPRCATPLCAVGSRRDKLIGHIE